MSETYRDGRLIERHDDTTRTVTTYAEDGTPTEHPYTADENVAADATLAATARLDDLTERVAALEAWRVEQQAADPDQPDAPTWDQLQPPNWWLSGALLTDTDGTVYRNTSGTVLTTPPSGFPGGGLAWRDDLFVVIASDPGPEPGVLAWAVDQQVEVGDKRTHNGRIWEAKLAHTTHAGWEPSAAAHAIWTDLGPA